MEQVKKYFNQMMDSLINWISRSPMIIACGLIGTAAGTLCTFSGILGLAFNCAAWIALMFMFANKYMNNQSNRGTGGSGGRGGRGNTGGTGQRPNNQQNNQTNQNQQRPFESV